VRFESFAMRSLKGRAMKITTPAEARTELEKRNFPAVFQKIWDGDVPSGLRYECVRPMQFFEFLPGFEEVVPSVANYLPLWETNEDSIVAYDMAREVYVRLYYGDMEDTVL